MPLDANGRKPRNDFEWFDSLIDKVRRSDDAYHARALDSWNAGADGIYLYNFFWEYENYHLSLSNFSSHRPLLKELGDPLVLKNRDKIYFASVQGMSNAQRWVTRAGPVFPKTDLDRLTTADDRGRNPTHSIEIICRGRRALWPSKRRNDPSSQLSPADQAARGKSTSRQTEQHRS